MPFEFICDNCNKPFTRKTRKVDKRGTRAFCSKICYYQSKQKYNEKPCPVCGVMFYPGKSNNHTFCSESCYKRNKHEKGIVKIPCAKCGELFKKKKSNLGRKNCDKCKNVSKPRVNFGGVEKKCKRCGKPFSHRASDIARGLNRVYCSEECRRPPHHKNCKNCGKKFRHGPSQDKQFCNFSCYRKFCGETRPERATREALELMGIAHIQEYRIERYSIDFFLTEYKTALEVDGVYWHDKAKDDRKTKRLTTKGYNVVRITDMEITSADDVCELIRDRLFEVGIFIEKLAQCGT